jgi:hypothetical protein
MSQRASEIRDNAMTCLAEEWPSEGAYHALGKKRCRTPDSGDSRRLSAVRPTQETASLTKRTRKATARDKVWKRQSATLEEAVDDIKTIPFADAGQQKIWAPLIRPLRFSPGWVLLWIPGMERGTITAESRPAPGLCSSRHEGEPAAQGEKLRERRVARGVRAGRIRRRR